MSNHVSMTDSVVIFSLAGHLGEEAHIRVPTGIFQLPCNAKAAQ